MADSRIKIIDSLIQEVSKFKMSDDHALFEAREWLGDKIDSYRATIIKKMSLEKANLSSCYQVVSCINVECLGFSCVIDGIPITSKSELWKADLPEMLDVPNALKYFGYANLKRPYHSGTLASLSSTFNRWNKKRYSYVKIGSSLYFTNDAAVQSFLLIGIMASPSLVCDFNEETPYPLPKEYQESLLLLIKKDLYQMLGVPIDLLNDTIDNPGMAPTPRQQQQQQRAQ